MLYWTVRWKWIAVGLAAVAVIGLRTRIQIFSGRLSGKLTNKVRLPGSFRVLSYNVEGFFGRDSLGKRENQVAEIARFIRESEPDIICMQEFELNRINPRVKFDSLLEAWKYSAFFSLRRAVPTRTGADWPYTASIRSSGAAGYIIPNRTMPRCGRT